MITILLAAYRMIPFRPRCSAGRHVRLCRMIVPHSKTLSCGTDDF